MLNAITVKLYIFIFESIIFLVLHIDLGQICLCQLIQTENIELWCLCYSLMRMDMWLFYNFFSINSWRQRTNITFLGYLHAHVVISQTFLGYFVLPVVSILGFEGFTLRMIAEHFYPACEAL